MASASMASPPTSRLRFLDTVGAPLEAPTEWAPALVEVLVAPAEWEHVRLWRQGQPAVLYLRVLAGKVRVLAEWPRSDPGYYRLRLEGGGESEEQTVTVHPQKIS